MTHIIGWKYSAHMLWPRDRWGSGWWREAWDANPGRPSNVLECSCGWTGSHYIVKHVGQWSVEGRQHMKDCDTGWEPALTRLVDEHRSGDQMTLEVA